MTEAASPDWESAVAAYDDLASRYDSIPQENRINGYLRAISRARLLATFKPDMKVLELGCGSGDEALALAAEGVKVVGLDPSRKMVELAREKARARSLADGVAFHVAPARELALPQVEREAPFQGAYASFSLAYESDLRPVAEALNRVLLPETPLLTSLPSRICALELLLAGLALRPSFAGRRLKPWYWHKVGSHRVPLRTFTPARLTREFGPFFAVKSVEGLAVAVPPAYMNTWYSQFPALCNILEGLDSVLRVHFPFRYLGDHFLVEMRRRSRKETES